MTSQYPRPVTIITLSRLSILKVLKVKYFIFIVNMDEIVHSSKSWQYTSLNSHAVFGWVIEDGELPFVDTKNMLNCILSQGVSEVVEFFMIS